jgi:serine/threonine protein kinase
MPPSNQILNQGLFPIANGTNENGIGSRFISENVNHRAKSLTTVSIESLLYVDDNFSEGNRDASSAELSEIKCLGERIKGKRSEVTLSEINEWCDRLLDALHHLHQQIPPVIHGDIRPQNIKLTPNGEVKLLFFEAIHGAKEKSNAAAVSDAGKAKTSAAHIFFSPLEQVLESLDRASREMILKNYDENSQKILEQPADARSDLFSLGATLYYLTTTRFPVDVMTRSIDILEGKADPLQAPHLLNAAIPVEISNVIMKALEIKREDRFISALIMRQVLLKAFPQVEEHGLVEVNQSLSSPEINEQDDLREINQQDDLLEIEHLDDLLEIPTAPFKVQFEPQHQEKAEFNTEQTLPVDLLNPESSEAEHKSSETGSETEEGGVRASNKEITQSAKVTTAETAATTAELDPSFSAETKAETFTAQDSATDEIGELFAKPRKENKLFKTFAATALIVLCGATWGVWNFALVGGGNEDNRSENPGVETKTAISSSETAPNPSPMLENVSAPASSFEATTTNPAVSTETNPETSAPPPPVKTEATVNQPGQKTKPASQQPQIKKPAAVSAKTPAPQKKTVTLDDLIN